MPAAPSSSRERTDQASTPEQPSRRASPPRTARPEDTASETSSVHSGEALERRDVDILTQVLSTRSEEYRLLFRLPSDEVLVQDFNCALQENLLLQGHMYLFIHYVCFYSNIFGFETKRTISFNEITDVRKAKTAGIFPNAIEIVAGEKRNFFGSFLSRDEAYRLIVDGWSQHSSDARAFLDRQDSRSDSNSRENGAFIIEGVNGSKQQTDDFNSSGRVPTNVLEICENGESNTKNSYSTESFTWKAEEVDAPEIPECFVLVAEANFAINEEDFFNLFFSDAAANFFEDFRKKCGDKDFQYTRWRRHDEFGHVRDLSFSHPIKIYFGAKFGQCQEIQKFRVYRNRHLTIQTSQQVSDVPYGDYFHVQGFWDVEGGENGCSLRIYLNVAFSRKTMWRGKIEQSTREECRDVYGIWINNAHELLKKKNLEKSEGSDGLPRQVTNIINNDNVGLKALSSLDKLSGNIHAAKPYMTCAEATPPKIMTRQEGGHTYRTSVVSFIKQLRTIFCLHSESHAQISPILFVALVAVIIVMQLSIVALLTRTPEIHLISDTSMKECYHNTAENVDWLEKRLHYLVKEMAMVESHMEKMHHEYTLLKSHLQVFQKFKRKS